MQTRKIGSLEVSAVGLGTNNFGQRIDDAATQLVIDAAIDAGVNFIDTADIYGGGRSEEFLGTGLKGRRDRVVLATKFGMSRAEGEPAGGSAAYVRSAAEASLSRLATEYIDLYYLHRPDPAVPIAETLGALGELVAEGKVREIACSNFSAAQLVEAEAAVAEGAPRFVAVQNRYSVLHREPEPEVLDECARLSIGFVPYSPVAGGLLTGKYRKGEPFPGGTRISAMPEERRQSVLNDRDLTTVEALRAFAASHGRTLLELAISWLLASSTVSSVIAGASTPTQLFENVAAAEWALTEDELAEIDAIAPRD